MATSSIDQWHRLRQLRQAEVDAELAWRQAHEEERRLKGLWVEARGRVLAYLDNGEEAEPLYDRLEDREPKPAPICKGCGKETPQPDERGYCLLCGFRHPPEQPTRFEIGTRVRHIELPTGVIVGCNAPLGWEVEWDDTPGEKMLQDEKSIQPLGEPEPERVEMVPGPPRAKRKRAGGKEVRPIVGLCPNCGVRVDDGPGSGPGALCDLCELKARQKVVTEPKASKPAVNRQCNRCNTVRPGSVGVCPSCRCPEFSLVGTKPDPACHRCGSMGGSEVDMPSMADADDDLITLDMCDIDLVLVPLGVSEELAPDLHICAKCHGELIEPKAKKPKRMKARKA